MENFFVDPAIETVPDVRVAQARLHFSLTATPVPKRCRSTPVRLRMGVGGGDGAVAVQSNSTLACDPW